MLNAKYCRTNANACIEMANDLIEPEMRERLFTLARACLAAHTIARCIHPRRRAVSGAE
jgi:hypothetical protein